MVVIRFKFVLCHDKLRPPPLTSALLCCWCRSLTSFPGCDPVLLGCWHTKNLFKNRHWLVTDPQTASLGNRYICLVHVNQACCLLSSASLSTFICSQSKITCSVVLQWRPCFPPSPPDTSRFTHINTTYNRPSTHVPTHSTKTDAPTSMKRTEPLIWILQTWLSSQFLNSSWRLQPVSPTDPSAGSPPAETSQHSSRAVQLLRSSSVCSRSVHIMQNVSRRAACKTAKQHQSESQGERNGGWRVPPSFLHQILESFHFSVCLKGV